MKNIIVHDLSILVDSWVRCEKRLHDQKKQDESLFLKIKHNERVIKWSKNVGVNKK